MLKEYGIDGIYIAHAKKGYEIHQKRIEKIFGELNLEHEFVTDGDIFNFNAGLLHKYFCDPKEKKLSKGILCCTLNHTFCYEKMVQHHNSFHDIALNVAYSRVLAGIHYQPSADTGLIYGNKVAANILSKLKMQSNELLNPNAMR